MVQAIQTIDEKAIYTENVLPVFCNFTTAHTYVVSSGAENASITETTTESYNDLGSISVEFTGTSEVIFSSGGTQMDTVIERDGKYKLSYAFLKDDPTADITFVVDVYVNEVLQSYNTISQNLYSTSGFIDGQWNVYWWDIALNSGDVVTYRFRAQSDTLGAMLFFSRMKLELANKNQSQPSQYTNPKITEIYATATLDFPSIAHNDTHSLTATVTGAKVGDFVQVVPPVEVATEKLTCIGIVTAEDTVTVIMSNNAGGSVDLASAVYKFHITRN